MNDLAKNKLESSWHLINVLAEESRKSTFHYIITHTANKHLIENLREIAYNLINGTFPLKAADKTFIKSRTKKLEYIANSKNNKKKIIEFLTKNHSIVRKVLILTLPFLREFVPKLG